MIFQRNYEVPCVLNWGGEDFLEEVVSRLRGTSSMVMVGFQMLG